MATSDEDRQAFLDRSSRATRGKRMNKLLDEEAEEDEAFWNQEALKDEENDNEYEEEGEAVDEFDSDFDEDESEADDGEQNEAEAREKRTRKRLTYPGKPSAKKKKKKKDLSKLEASLRDEMKKDYSKSELDDENHSGQPTTPDHADDIDEVGGERTVRKSTRTAVVVKQAEREAIRAALQATTKPVKRKREGEEKRMTQEEMLLEAAQTEIMNLRNLERVLAREEEVKKRAIMQKPAYTGPEIRYSSKDGQTYIEFRNGASFDSEIRTKSVPYPQKAVCVITGLPAKYRDPKTGLPYASKEAFRILRERYASDNTRSNGKAANGYLFDALSGQGFLSRRKRSFVTPQNEASRDSRRFCTILGADDLDSD